MAASTSSWVPMAIGPLTMVAGVVLVVAEAAEIWCSALGRRWVWWSSVVRVRGDVLRRGSRTLTHVRSTHSRCRCGGGGRSEIKALWGIILVHEVHM